MRVEETSAVVVLQAEVTTVGQGPGVDLVLASAAVSPLHAELVRRGPHVYVADEGLSTNGTAVNGRPVGRRVLREGDVLAFADARVTFLGPDPGAGATVALRRPDAPRLTPREQEVLDVLVAPGLSDAAFVEPASAREVAEALVVTEAAVKQHLLRLYAKFRVPEGPGRRQRLANEVLAAGLVRPARRRPAP